MKQTRKENTKKTPTGFSNEKSVESYKNLVTLNEIGDHYSKDIINKLPKKEEGISILDIGTGDGRFLSFILSNLGEDSVKKLEAFDLSENMLKKAKKQYSKFNGLDFELYKENLNNIKECPLKEKYDYINFTFALHYAEKPKEVLDNIIKYLDKDGVMLLTGCKGLFNHLVDSPNHIDKKLVPKEISDLWKDYFELKHKKYPKWEPSSIGDPTNTKPLIEFLSSKKDLDISIKEYFWNKKISLEDNLEWILSSPISSISAGVDDSYRREIYNNLKNKYNKKGMLLDKKLSVTLGYELIFIKKR